MQVIIIFLGSLLGLAEAPWPKCQISRFRPASPFFDKYRRWPCIDSHSWHSSSRWAFRRLTGCWGRSEERKEGPRDGCGSQPCSWECWRHIRSSPGVFGRFPGIAGNVSRPRCSFTGCGGCCRWLRARRRGSEFYFPFILKSWGSTNTAAKGAALDYGGLTDSTKDRVSRAKEWDLGDPFRLLTLRWPVPSRNAGRIITFCSWSCRLGLCWWDWKRGRGNWHVLMLLRLAWFFGRGPKPRNTCLSLHSTGRVGWAYR